MNKTQLQDIKMRYGIVGDSAALNRALDVCLQVASTDLSVLIVGESGVGKEVLPKIIHDNSPRKRETYLAINCGSIPEGTIDSELFGHEKGAFTGAIGESDGYFGATNKGTLFLDEVGELPLATQARLLRVLETGEYIRVGGQQVRKTDVRIVAATNVNMQKAISEGRFREDLYYRLNTIPVKMPPLRERGNDVLLLFRLFAMNMASKYGSPRHTLTEDAKRIMLKYKWPGNIRQLKNITEQISVLVDETEISAEKLLEYISDDPESTALATISSGFGGNSSGHSYESERELLYKILYELRGNVSSLRHEMNELRKQMDDHKAVNASLDSRLTSLSSLSSERVPAVASGSLSAIDDSHGMTPEFEDAVAEEILSGEATHITPNESLNIDKMERQLLEKALARNNGNRKKAARELGISDRTLYRRLKQYGLE